MNGPRGLECEWALEISSQGTQSINAVLTPSKAESPFIFSGLCFTTLASQMKVKWPRNLSTWSLKCVGGGCFPSLKTLEALGSISIFFHT
ncbi:hypothetical protein NPIL_204101 [Nephila pilipes]|uniref:Uncharacterized protein n=1 Tax=Nephila pilipes TaxID=299642 RepID=A0A8X6TW98_NEPPI|nr:hypothetical protein NPIL_204101 [Nephila pilipes]